MALPALSAACHLLVSLAAAAVLVWMIPLVLDDLSSHTDEFDGLTVFFGGMISAVALLVGSASVLLLVLTGRATAGAPGGFLGSGFGAVVLGALGTFVSFGFLHLASGHNRPLIVAVLLFSVGYAGVGAALVAVHGRAGPSRV